METHTLELELPVADVLTCALLRTIDDLEAHAIIAEHHDTDLGPTSAAGYRTDIRRLQTILTQLAPDSCRRDPDPEQSTIQWIDGFYAIAHGRPLRLTPQSQIQTLVESALAMVDHDLIDPHHALTSLHHALDQDPPTQTDSTTTLDDDPDPTLPVSPSSDTRTSSLPDPQAARGCPSRPEPSDRSPPQRADARTRRSPVVHCDRVRLGHQ